jgi:two-component system, sensor histidine kinase and response regulator
VAAKTILIVDDDLPFAQFLEELLTEAGYDTVVAKHGAAAFADLEITRPDLMIVDIFMPVIDGITFCRMARANRSTRDTPIIVISATPHLAGTIPVPIAGIVAKPVETAALLDLVTTLIEAPMGERRVGA